MKHLLQNVSSTRHLIRIVKRYHHSYCFEGSGTLPNYTRHGLSKLQNHLSTTSSISPRILVAKFHTCKYFQQQDDGYPPDNSVRLPTIMSYPKTAWPNFLNTCRNWFFYHYVIRRYMDQSFSLEEFDLGARHAISVVSNKLADGKYDDLVGLVDATVLKEVKEVVSRFTAQQRELIRVNMSDILVSFPFQIGIILPDTTQPVHRQSFRSPDEYAETSKPQQRYVEITVVMHVLRQMNSKIGRDNNRNKSFKELAEPESLKNLMVCNYRFFKDFTEGASDSSWIINTLNQFIPYDHRN